MEHFTKKVLLPLIALVVSSVPGLAQITVYHGATTADAASIVTNGIQNVNRFFSQGGAGLYVTTDYSVALAYADAAAQNAAAAGLTGPAAQPYVLEMVLTEGATVGEFAVEHGFANLGQQIIGDLSHWEDIQGALNQFDVLKVVNSVNPGLGGETSYMIVHASAEGFVGVVNPPAIDLALVPATSYAVKAEQMAQAALSQAGKIIVGNAGALNSDTVQVLENTGQMTAQVIQKCSWWCGVAAALTAMQSNLRMGLQVGADNLTDALQSSAGIGSVMTAEAIYGSVSICDSYLDSLCSSNINTSLSYLLFGPDNGTGRTLTSQTFNPYTGAMERDYSDGSTTWTRNNGINTGVTASGVGWAQNPQTGEVSQATPIDGQDVKSSQIMQVNFSGQTEYLTQAGFSLTLDDAQSAVQSINALNSVAYQYPALFQIPVVVPILDPYGTPTPAAPPDQSGTSTTTGTTSQGNQYTTTVQKDSSGNIVAEYTVTIGTNFTMSKDDLTGTSQTIQRNPDGSTTMFNCIQSGTVCASSNGGIINYDDGWHGNNPYDASNQSFTLSLPGYSGVGAGGGGGGGGGSSIIPANSVVNPYGCDALGC